MPKSDFHDYVIQDLMSHIPGIKSRVMFGGWGIYKDGVIFGIIADDELYFKVDETNRKKYEAAGSKPFTYDTKKRKKIVMSYWEVPPDILEDRDEIVRWVEESCRISGTKPKRAKT